MREKARIKPFLKAIEKIWLANPDWRFGQLASNICNAGLKENNRSPIHDHFYTEDGIVKDGIESLLEIEEKHEIAREQRENRK